MPEGTRLPPPTPARPGPAEPGDVRHRILDAAERIVQARGVPALTLEAAAREAGVSKGGLLYHFASKEALLTGLLNRLAGHVAADFEAVLAAEPPHPARVTRAILAWTFDDPRETCEKHLRAAGVFLAAFHHDPALLDPIRRVFADIRARLGEDDLPPGHALAVMAAGDGLFMARLFGLYEQTPEEMAALRAALSRLAEPAA